MCRVCENPPCVYILAVRSVILKYIYEVQMHKMVAMKLAAVLLVMACATAHAGGREAAKEAWIRRDHHCAMSWYIINVLVVVICPEWAILMT